MPGTPIANASGHPTLALTPRRVDGSVTADLPQARSTSATAKAVMQSTPVTETTSSADAKAAGLNALMCAVQFFSLVRPDNKGAFFELGKTYDSMTRFLGNTPYEKAVRREIAALWLNGVFEPCFHDKSASYYHADLAAKLTQAVAPDDEVSSAHRSAAASDLSICRNFYGAQSSVSDALPKNGWFAKGLDLVGLRETFAPVGFQGFEAASKMLGDEPLDQAIKATLAGKWLAAASATGKLSRADLASLEAVRDATVSPEAAARAAQLFDVNENVRYDAKIIYAG